MVAASFPAFRPNPLQHGELALREAAARLAEARDAFHRAGRSDLSSQVAAAIVAVREAELVRLVGLDSHPTHDPADWFQE